MRKSKPILFPIVAIFTLVSTSALAQVSVGWDNACDYNVGTDPVALQTAIDDGHGEIRLSAHNPYPGHVVIDSDLVLRGGFADCTAAGQDDQTNINSVIDAAGEGTTAVTVENIDDADVRLEYLTLENADGQGANVPGGLALNDLTGAVSLHHLLIRNNLGFHGGGLGIDIGFGLEFGSLTVGLSQTVIRDNTGNRGGGMHCEPIFSTFTVEVDLHDGTTLRGNHAEHSGGGMHVKGCLVDYQAGIATHGVSSGLDREIIDNTSDVSGGGLVVFGPGVVVLSGSAGNTFDLTNNDSNLDPAASGQGGAAQVGSGGRLEIFNGNISHNSTGRYGGGLFAGFGGEILVDRLAEGCSYDRYCSRISGNLLTRTFPGGGGALAARFGGRIEVRATDLRFNNSDDRGYIGYAESDFEGQNAALVLEGCVLEENGTDNDFNNSSGFAIQPGAEATLAYSTTLRNRSAATLFSQQNDSDLLLTGNILFEFGNVHQVSGTAQTAIDCNLIRSLDTVEVPVNNTVEGDVDHIDAAARDYRLAASDTLAMDRCDNSLYTPGTDLAGAPRGLDMPSVADVEGPFDLGAYEFDPGAADAIFSDAFEAAK